MKPVTVGFGDSETWGPITGPRDPRVSDPCDVCDKGVCQHCNEGAGEYEDDGADLAEKKIQGW